MTNHKKQAEKLAQRLRRLADHFRSLRGNDAESGERIRRRSIEVAAKLVKQCVDESLLELPARFDWPNPPQGFFQDQSGIWGACWCAIVIQLTHKYPAELPSDPWLLQPSGSVEGFRESRPEDWQAHAANDALICDWLADHIEGGKATTRSSGGPTAVDKARLEAVRAVLLDRGRNATRKVIQAELTKRGGSGISNDTLTAILDVLRETGEYLVPANKRKKFCESSTDASADEEPNAAQAEKREDTHAGPSVSRVSARSPTSRKRSPPGSTKHRTR